MGSKGKLVNIIKKISNKPSKGLLLFSRKGVKKMHPELKITICFIIISIIVFYLVLKKFNIGGK
jgi:hypothetical protein